jgi:DNA-binding MarR family transcriptional regulator
MLLDMADTQQLYELIKSIFIVIYDGDRNLMESYDLSVSRYYALYHIGKEPGMSFSQLSERMLCDKSNVTRIVKTLEKNGLVYRSPHETDGRSIRLFLTKTGKQTRNKISNDHLAYNEERFNVLAEVKQNDLFNTLSTLKANLEAQLVAE